MNMSIKGEPISMELEGLDIPQIRDKVFEELEYYSQLQGKMK
jgi:hypothetical protein